MARLIAALVRHGDYHQLPDTPSAHQPWPLTGEGEAQAQAGAQALHELVVRNGWSLVPAIDSSRMLRAWQTALIFADRLAGLASTTPHVDSHDALAERCVGCLANLTMAQIEAVLQQDPRVPIHPLAGRQTATTACRCRAPNPCWRLARGWPLTCRSRWRPCRQVTMTG